MCMLRLQSVWKLNGHHWLLQPFTQKKQNLVINHVSLCLWISLACNCSSTFPSFQCWVTVLWRGNIIALIAETERERGVGCGVCVCVLVLTTLWGLLWVFNQHSENICGNWGHFGRSSLCHALNQLGGGRECPSRKSWAQFHGHWPVQSSTKLWLLKDIEVESWGVWHLLKSACVCLWESVGRRIAPDG